MSGGQRSQLALALVIGKQPDLLLLDEPMASLDALARRQFMSSLMAFAAEARTTIVLSSHLVADLERICDYLIVMVDSRVHLAGTVDEILARHYRLTSRRDDEPRPSLPYDLVHAVRSERQVAQAVRSTVPVTRAASHVESLSLEDITLAYLESGLGDAPPEVSPQTGKSDPMIWLIWRQLRTQVSVGVAAVAALAITSCCSVSRCVTPTPTASPAASPVTPATPPGPFETSFTLLGCALLALPGMLGAFWGAPIVARELESGTFRMIWTQGVTRRSWVVAKLVGVTLSSAAIAGTAGALLTWAAGPL